MEYSRDPPYMKLYLAVLVSLHGYSCAQGNCGGHLRSSSGTIESPNYPAPYPDGQECTWFVSAEGSVEDIKVSFSAFNLQPKLLNGQCKDYVAIYSLLLNEDARATLEGKFCGDSVPLSMRITESSLTVQFVSDSGPEASSSYTGFSLHYEVHLEGSSGVSQTTAGIVAAIFCAVVFIGVGTLRCFLTGACGNYCNEQRAGGQRQVVGTNESNAFQADFPPSYSTVMSHPERFPTPESSPLFLHRNGTAAVSSQPPSEYRHQRTFTLRSDDSESSDNDEDELSLPPPYPGNVEGENQVNYNGSIACNTTTEASNTETRSLTASTDERSIGASNILEIPPLLAVMEDEIRPPVSNVHDAASAEAPERIPVIVDHSRDREIFERSLGQSGYYDNTEEVVI